MSPIDDTISTLDRLIESTNPQAQAVTLSLTFTPKNFLFEQAGRDVWSVECEIGEGRGLMLVVDPTTGVGDLIQSRDLLTKYPDTERRHTDTDPESTVSTAVFTDRRAA